MTIIKHLNNEKILGLQALRALSFIGIFLYHAGSPCAWSLLGVSNFFVLSGFLMMISYSSTDLPETFQDSLRFSLKKISKLYPLHIITMLFAVVLTIIVNAVNGILSTRTFVIISEWIALNATLLQTWVCSKNYSVSLNGVAWYLSVTVFLYFCFPRIRRYIKQRGDFF